MEGSGEHHDSATGKRRSRFVGKLGLLIAPVMGIAIVLAIVVAVILKKYAGTLQAADAAMTSRSAIAFAIVFLSYGVAAIFFVIFFVYRSLSPFKRLTSDMEDIVSGDTEKRLNLRDKDVYLIKDFVGSVNTLAAKHDQMHHIKDELHRYMDTEGQRLLSLVEQDDTMDGKVKAAIISYHKTITSIVRDKT